MNVGALMRQINGVFGGETTGHFFYKENYDADSGLIVALTAMQALTDSGKKLSELVDEYRRYAMIAETNFETTAKEKIFEELKKEYADGEQDMLDGLTVNYPDFWFNMRASNTEPVMRLNAEAATQAQLDLLVGRLTAIINSAE